MALVGRWFGPTASPGHARDVVCLGSPRTIEFDRQRYVIFVCRTRQEQIDIRVDVLFRFGIFRLRIHIPDQNSARRKMVLSEGEEKAMRARIADRKH
jgi:hypothetical protein